MAEYIDKQKYREEWLKFKTFEPMKCLDLIPTADVIERSKIDKAIEEINDLNLSWVASHYEDRFYGFQQEVLEILKRNIGE